MGATRALLLAASQNRWLRNHASRYAFVKRSVSRFMPGETLDDAIAAARDLRRKNIASVFTHLGENIFDEHEAENVAAHYQHVLERIQAQNLDSEISVKAHAAGTRSFAGALRTEFTPFACRGTTCKDPLD